MLKPKPLIKIKNSPGVDLFIEDTNFGTLVSIGGSHTFGSYQNEKNNLIIKMFVLVASTTEVYDVSLKQKLSW